MILSIAGCGTATDVSTGSGVSASPVVGVGLPSPHVHGIAIDPSDGLIYLATHDGLFRYDDTGSQRIGPVIDLMGFTVAGPRRFLASGHPGAGTDLPNPVGLIQSDDAGQTWSELSRQEESDFHTLTASTAGVLGYDGALRSSPDGAVWEEVPATLQPLGLAAAPGGGTVLATTSTGAVMRSQDDGRSWTENSGAAGVAVVAWGSDDFAVGVTAEGATVVSGDAGTSWQRRADLSQQPLAVAAAATASGVRVVVATPRGILQSTDGGASFTEFRPGSTG